MDLITKLEYLRSSAFSSTQGMRPRGTGKKKKVASQMPRPDAWNPAFHIRSMLNWAHFVLRNSFKRNPIPLNWTLRSLLSWVNAVLGDGGEGEGCEVAPGLHGSVDDLEGLLGVVREGLLHDADDEAFQDPVPHLSPAQ